MSQFNQNVANRAAMTVEEIIAEVNERVKRGELVLPEDQDERTALIGHEILAVLNEHYERCNLETQ